jgi:hypothetical protein
MVLVAADIAQHVGHAERRRRLLGDHLAQDDRGSRNLRLCLLSASPPPF